MARAAAAPLPACLLRRLRITLWSGRLSISSWRKDWVPLGQVPRVSPGYLVGLGTSVSADLYFPRGGLTGRQAVEQTGTVTEQPPLFTMGCMHAG